MSSKVKIAAAAAAGYAIGSYIQSATAPVAAAGVPAMTVSTALSTPGMYNIGGAALLAFLAYKFA